MSEQPTRSSTPKWLTGAVVTFLALQVGLLWMQGTMLERQHGDLQSLRLDVQDLTESLEEFQGSFDQGPGDTSLQPSRHRIHARGHSGRRATRVRLDEPEGDQGVRKELEDQRKSEREGIEKAREARSQLSIEENARKADEKAKIEAAEHKYRPLIWAGVAVGLLALFLRSWLRNRG